MKKHSYEYVKSIVESAGGTLLSTEYKNSKVPLDVMCNSCNNVFRPSLNNLQKGSWCISCSGYKNTKYTLGEVSDVIEKRGGTLLSKSYINASKKLIIMCNQCNNVWNPVFRDIMSGRWCACGKVSNPQRLLFDIIVSLFSNRHFTLSMNYSGFDWLKNPKTGKKQEIDIFVRNVDKSFSLAVEYDGQQHFRPVSFGGISGSRAVEKFELQKKMDRRKNKLIRKHSADISHFVRFNYREKLSKEYVVEKLLKSGIDMSSLYGGKTYGRTKCN